MRSWKTYPRSWHILDEVAFIAVFVGVLIMIMAGGVTSDALRAAAYLAGLTSAWRAGMATRSRMRNRRGYPRLDGLAGAAAGSPM